MLFGAFPPPKRAQKFGISSLVGSCKNTDEFPLAAINQPHPRAVESWRVVQVWSRPSRDEQKGIKSTMAAGDARGVDCCGAAVASADADDRSTNQCPQRLSQI